ncbi:hypothetical protein Q4F19_21125 [Sphingomonas sp. BIUV-7]|uniref:Uncharacterized protein n=1 Tax=Sphingomonas natans TaxID=3063330 RepID=A0ABT8YEV8_9SPHN|nr:hypothetical protein [Sphingomonas sp. BIUV-7]MDO6416900.1 hypothetical protein [Sphingomonas sp. BIUV-7]
MPCYRLFHRSAQTGRIVDSEVLGDCADDREALMRLADHMRGLETELWERGRLVAILKSAAQAA